MSELTDLYQEVILDHNRRPHNFRVIDPASAKQEGYNPLCGDRLTLYLTVNGGVIGMVRTMAVELAPIRVNAIHPGVIGDSPYWADKPEGALDPIAARTPIGRLVNMRELSEAALFLLENGAVNGINLAADGGWTLK